MKDDGSSESTSVWPSPKFYFDVEWGGEKMSFQEVSGLDAEAEPVEYRRGSTPEFSTVKMPGMVKHGNVVLKKGMFKSSSKFWDWFGQVKMNTVERTQVTISLLDEGGAPSMIWRLENAWLVKITSPDLRAEDADVTIETIEIAYERMTVSNA